MVHLLLGDIKTHKEAVQVAIAGYRMVPHRGTGFSPFMMLYGREAITAEEVPYVEYSCDGDYDQALQEHVIKLWNIHEKARATGKLYAQRTKAYYDRKRVGSKVVELFNIDDLVWIDLRRVEPTKRKGGIKWLGPCVITEITPGPLYNLKYFDDVETKKYTRIHPQFLKLYRGETT